MKNKLGDAEDASKDTFEDSSVEYVLENEFGGIKSASISEHFSINNASRNELFWWRLLPPSTMILLKTTLCLLVRIDHLLAGWMYWNI